MQKTRELFEHELRDMYDAELKLVSALETMASKCTNPKLVQGFEKHREVTQTQAERLEEIFGLIGRAPRREPCAGINGLIEEFSRFVKEDPSEEILDVFACSGALKVEQYEIVAYTSLISLASKLGLNDAVELLETTLQEEQRTAQELEGAAPELERLLDAEIVLPEDQPASKSP